MPTVSVMVDNRRRAIEEGCFYTLMTSKVTGSKAPGYNAVLSTLLPWYRCYCHNLLNPPPPYDTDAPAANATFGRRMTAFRLAQLAYEYMNYHLVLEANCAYRSMRWATWMVGMYC